MIFLSLAIHYQYVCSIFYKVLARCEEANLGLAGRSVTF